MQYKILSLTILNLSAYIGKQQKKKKKDKIHEQVALKKSDILLSMFTRKTSKKICSAV